MLTIAYITSRKDPCFSWFLDSLKLQTDQLCKDIRLVVVDFHANSRPEPKNALSDLGGNWIWTDPKPCVWQGKHRLTKENWFAASNARNTALCFAPDGWIAYVDDLSVLAPGWLRCVQEAMDKNYIVYGTYQKVKDLKVIHGLVESFTPMVSGNDSRWKGFPDMEAVPCVGDILYGCSLAGPVDAFLEVNGWPEDLCDGLGSEDSLMGIVMGNTGKYQFRFDRRMMTIESEEMHHVGSVMRKEDWHLEKGIAHLGGNGGDDKSHAALNIARGSKSFPNHFNIRDIRSLVLSGGRFPMDLNPCHDWYSGKPLSEL